MKRTHQTVGEKNPPQTSGRTEKGGIEVAGADYTTAGHAIDDPVR